MIYFESVSEMRRRGLEIDNFHASMINQNLDKGYKIALDGLKLVSIDSAGKENILIFFSSAVLND